MREWADHIERDIRKTLGAHETGSVATAIDFVVGQGGSWAEALADVSWGDHEVVVVGASSSVISRFFLGSHASKIVRSSPVPVLLMPRTLS